MTLEIDSSKQGPLRGVRILDLATVVAAPFAGTLCADMGAEVVKVELPNGGDALRTLAPVWQEHELFGRLLTEAKRHHFRRTPDWRARFILAHATTF